MNQEHEDKELVLDKQDKKIYVEKEEEEEEEEGMQVVTEDNG